MELAPPQVTVRPAAAADDAALLALDRAAWTPGSGLPSTKEPGRTAFFDEHRSPDTHLVAEHGGRVVGCVAVRPRLRFAEAAHVFGIWHLLVDPGARRMGVASALLRAAERRALTGGARKLGLNVLSSNAGAIRLYERHGYRVEGRCAGEFLIDGVLVDDLILGKWLEDGGPRP